MNSAILDTSILIKLGSKKVGSAVSTIISTDLKDADLFISEICCYEFLRGVESRADVLTKQSFLKKWPRLPVDKELLKIATYYYNILFKHSTHTGGTAFNMRQFSDSDIFIGATSIQNAMLVCTVNGADFPRPLFEEVSVTKISQNEKVYILKPDTEYFLAETQKFMDPPIKKGSHSAS